MQKLFLLTLCSLASFSFLTTKTMENKENEKPLAPKKAWLKQYEEQERRRQLQELIALYQNGIPGRPTKRRLFN